MGVGLETSLFSFFSNFGHILVDFWAPKSLRKRPRIDKKSYRNRAASWKRLGRLLEDLRPSWKGSRTPRSVCQPLGSVCHPSCRARWGQPGGPELLRGRPARRIEPSNYIQVGLLLAFRRVRGPCPECTGARWRS